MCGAQVPLMRTVLVPARLFQSAISGPQVFRKFMLCSAPVVGDILFLSWFASVFLICICFVKLRRLKLSWSPLGNRPRSHWSDNNRLHFHIDGRAPELYGSVFIFNTAAEFPHNYITNRATLSHHLPLMCSRNSRAVASHLFQMKWPMCASANPNSDASKKKKDWHFPPLCEQKHFSSGPCSEW